METYRTMLQSGIPAHQELELKPGKYRLRLGIIDRATNKVGTLDVPLTVANN
jgi:peptidyl-tRNA hydrolase